MFRFTKETAAEFGRKGAAISNQRWKLPRNPPPLPPPITDDSAAIQRTKLQLVKLDEMIDAALARKDEGRFLRLSSAKERLWKLVQPTAGALRPSSKRSRVEIPDAVPIPQAPTPTPSA